MRIVSSIHSMQQLALAWRRNGERVGFVPTMGYLHAGHVSLIARARKAVGPGGKVVVSIYVNPTQFGANEDLSSYPRDFKRDATLCRDAGVDAIFYPGDSAMYPGRKEGLYSSYVVEEALSSPMEGSSRPSHFRGVTTVVAKLFNIVLPDVAIFGSKDYQQAAVIQRMTKDLNFPVRILVAPTVRERDGLALSSRNKYLNPAQRQQAIALWQSIKVARESVRKARSIPAVTLKAKLKRQIEAHAGARLDYIEFFNPADFRPASNVEPGTHMALAVFIGKTRLIDNARL